MTDPQPAVTPPAMLGILGGGQLGLYFVMAARTMGFRTTVLDPDPHAPAGRVADVHLVAPSDDPAALGEVVRRLVGEARPNANMFGFDEA